MFERGIDSGILFARWLWYEWVKKPLVGRHLAVACRLLSPQLTREMAVDGFSKRASLNDDAWSERGGLPGVSWMSPGLDMV